METASTSPSTDAPHAPAASDATPVIAPVHSPESRQMGSTGSVIAILLIVALLVVGAFYVWGQRLSEQESQQYVPAVAE